MTKLQSLVAEIEALPAEEQKELVLMLSHLSEDKTDFFELTEVELAELDRRLLNVDKEPTFTPEEAFTSLRQKYVHSEVE